MSEAKGDPLSRSLCPFSVKNAFIKKAPIQNNRIGAYAQSLFDVDNFNVEGHEDIKPEVGMMLQIATDDGWLASSTTTLSFTSTICTSMSPSSVAI